MQVRLPSPSRLKDKELRDYLSQLVQALERTVEKLPETPFTKNRIVITNVSAGYVLDSSGAGLAELRAAFTALVRDLQASGKIA